MADGSFKPGGRTDDEVWAAAREAYLSGATASQVCRRFGLGKSTFWARAADEGWRRADQSPLQPLDYPSGVLDDTFAEDLAGLARSRLAQALAQGRLAETAGWLRVYKTLRDAADQDDMF